jgi:hypothetical protein
MTTLERIRAGLTPDAVRGAQAVALYRVALAATPSRDVLQAIMEEATGDAARLLDRPARYLIHDHFGLSDLETRKLAVVSVFASSGDDWSGVIGQLTVVGAHLEKGGHRALEQGVRTHIGAISADHPEDLDAALAGAFALAMGACVADAALAAQAARALAAQGKEGRQ